jgi:gliding motility-associated-like protein
MKKWRRYTILIIFCLYTFRAGSQTCVLPLPPVLTRVSVQPETGYTDFTWTPSPSADIAAYLVYSYHNENGIPRGDIIDTIWDPSATTCTYKSTISRYYSVSYVVASFRNPKCTSPFSNVINTMFTEASVDTCNKKIHIKWNSYPSVPLKVLDYSVLVAVNGGNYTEAGKVTPLINSFDLNDFVNNAAYCFIVKAGLEGGVSSWSNVTCISTKMQRPPDWINADFATADQNNNIELSFTADPLSGISSYRLERKTADETGFSLITKIESATGKITYTDKTANPDKINFYRLLAVNNCGNPVVSSNLSCNIVPVLDKKDNIIKLTWNSYRYWLGEVSGYKVFIDRGSGFSEFSSIPPADTFITVNYTSVMYDISGARVCFCVDALEKANPHGISGETMSSPVCTDIIENIIVPNAFTPNNDLKNDYFRPVLSFTPVEYHIVITDRNNNVLFESRDYLEEWDGKKNGEILTQGVCLWFLNIKTPSGKQIARSGTVTTIK